MGLKLANNARSVLTASIVANDVVIGVQVGHGQRFPTLEAGDWFPLVIQDAQGNHEIVKATARTGDSITVERAQESTTALPFDAGSAVYLPLTVGALTELIGAGAAGVSITDTEVVG